MRRAVLDASVLVAAACSPNRQSASRLVLRAVALRVVRPIVSAPVAAEYHRALTNPKLRRWLKVTRPDRFAAALVSLAEVVVPVEVSAVKADPSDDVYLGTALAGGAGHVVTLDRQHLIPLDGFRGLRILTPGDFLGELRSTG